MIFLITPGYIKASTLSLADVLHSPEHFAHTQITVRGFLYQTDGGYVLSTQPNLATCCLIQSLYLPVEGSFPWPTPTHAVVMTGDLTHDRSWKLINAKVVIEEKSNVLFGITGISVILALLGLFRHRINELLSKLQRD